MNAYRRNAVDLLNQLVNGRMKIDDVLMAWPVDANDVLLEKIRCLLDHYADDADIRKKDPKYAEWQKMEVAGYVSELTSSD